jgi:hypothetical protein
MTTKQKPAEVVKPATKEQKPATGVGIKDLAADLGRDPRSTRAAIRRFKGGAQVGQGGRYNWSSKSDKDYKELVAALKGKAAPKTAE